MEQSYKINNKEQIKLCKYRPELLIQEHNYFKTKVLNKTKCKVTYVDKNKNYRETFIYCFPFFSQYYTMYNLREKMLHFLQRWQPDMNNNVIIQSFKKINLKKLND